MGFSLVVGISGGHVTDWGVHHTDIAIWALGGEEQAVVEAEEEGVFPGSPRRHRLSRIPQWQVKTPTAIHVTHEFDCNLTLANDNTINFSSGNNELIISGDQGRIRVNRGKPHGSANVEEINADPQRREWLDEEVRKLYRKHADCGSHGQLLPY